MQFVHSTHKSAIYLKCGNALNSLYCVHDVWRHKETMPPVFE